MIFFKRKSMDKIVNKAGRDLVNFTNDHDIIILNGIKKVAPMTSIQTKGCSVIDYIMCDRSMYNKVKKFQTEEENNIISDHRFLSIEIEGNLDSKNLVNEDKIKERKIEEKRGWRRKIKNIAKICERNKIVKRFGKVG